MNYLQYFDSERVVETCVAGAGDFGRGILRQAQQMPALSARIAIDVSPDTAAQALRLSGVPDSQIMVCHSPEQAQSAWQSGHYVAAGSLESVKHLPFDILVESTGIPNVGAYHAEAAILAGKHVGIATKETESVVGPYLTRLAERHDRLFTPLDGDQPSLLIGLVTWAQTLGFEIVAAGKSSEYDFIWDEADGAIWCNGNRYSAHELAPLWTLPNGEERATVQARSKVLSAIPQISVPDLCEMTNVANATGLVPDLPEFHAMVLRTDEVPSLLDLQEFGGVLQGTGRLEVFNCLRRPDEVSFAGGVFVIVRCEDPEAWELLRGKGHVLSRSGKAAMVYLPRHLLGLEAPISLLDAVQKGLPSGGGPATAPHVDLIARTTQAFTPGQRLEMKGHHRHIEGLRPEVHPASALSGESPVPFYLLPDAEIVRPVAAHQPITLADVALPDSHLHRLRQAQDTLFFPDPPSSTQQKETSPSSIL
ncbi:flagellar biosynthesis protein FlgA [Halomonas sp. NO4]|uniref:NAD(P)H-dependent oxidoreductase n=1 Tax=Halomonas sp. NO4 TaxID=2484813 RepID=UPI0013D699ED|nr:flagellar biosynthesis protein FlgA [Halomonas sp. NO4]